MTKPLNIDEYISRFPRDIQVRLQSIRMILKSVLPEADEVISYGMPAFRQKKIVVYFAGYESHIGFYPTSKPIDIFKEKLKLYKFSKGAIQISHAQSIPEDLIKEITLYRLKNL